MSSFRIALASLRFPASPEEALAATLEAVGAASDRGAGIVAFPECFLPGYRGPGTSVPPPDPEFLARAWRAVAEAAGEAGIGVVLGTERWADGKPVPSVVVVGPRGETLGFQDKVQLDPSEEATYGAAQGRERGVFQVGSLTCGVVICHEGWRYPETTREVVRQGAQVVFHPHYHVAEEGGVRPTGFCDPRNTFHEKAALCRAAENTCYFATINYASDGAPTASAVVGPEGEVVGYQPYGEEGLLVVDVDLGLATGKFARRLRSE